MKIIGLGFLLCCSSLFGVEPFSLPWMNHLSPGTFYSTQEHPRGVFVIHALLTVCPGNYELAPMVNQLTDDYSDEPRVQVLDIGLDSSDANYTKWIKNVNPNHPVLKDKARTVLRALGVSQFPTTVIMDEYGTVHYRFPGVWTDKEHREIRAILDWLLAKPVASLARVLTLD